MQYGDLARDGAHEIHVVLHHHHGVFARQRGEQLPGALHLLVGHAGDRFVHQQQLGILHQQHADFEPLLLAVGERAGVSAAMRLQANDLQHVINAIKLCPSQACPEGRPDALVAGHGEFQVFKHAVEFKYRRFLEFAADARLRNLRFVEMEQVDVLAEIDAPPVGSGLAGDDVHHRRLARPVGADNAAQFTGIDIEVQLVDRFEAVEADRDILQVENGAVAEVHLEPGGLQHKVEHPVAAHHLAQIL